jgi:twitching motility protein PilT
MDIEIRQLLDAAIARNATDLHLEVGSRPAIRIGGIMEEMDARVLTPEDTETMAQAVTSQGKRNILDARGYLEFWFCPHSAPDKHFFISLWKREDGINLLFRRIPMDIWKREAKEAPQ